MVQLHCPIEGCPYVTIDGSEVVACALLVAHTPSHNVAPAPMTSGPKLEQPKIDIGVTLNNGICLNVDGTCLSIDLASNQPIHHRIYSSVLMKNLATTY